MNKRGFIEYMGIEIEHGPLRPFEKNNIKKWTFIDIKQNFIQI